MCVSRRRKWLSTCQMPCKFGFDQGLCRAHQNGVSLQVVLVACGNYNLHNDNMEVGIGQSEALQILTRMFGHIDTAVLSLKNHLEKIRAGEQKTIPDRMLPK